jgi:anthranilate synthase component 2/putative glutamine amidotransferase
MGFVGDRPIIRDHLVRAARAVGAWGCRGARAVHYVESVERAGGRALVVPPSVEAVDETLDVLDGVIFSGGIDIDPSTYGADRHEKTDPGQAHRDAGELALLERALARDIPTLAIFRGFQLLNVARGGDLIQHLPGGSATRASRGPRHVLEPGRRAKARSSPRSRRTPRRAVGHHQGVGRW